MQHMKQALLESSIRTAYHKQVVPAPWLAKGRMPMQADLVERPVELAIYWDQRDTRLCLLHRQPAPVPPRQRLWKDGRICTAEFVEEAAAPGSAAALCEVRHASDQVGVISVCGHFQLKRLKRWCARTLRLSERMSRVVAVVVKRLVPRK